MQEIGTIQVARLTNPERQQTLLDLAKHIANDLDKHEDKRSFRITNGDGGTKYWLNSNLVSTTFRRIGVVWDDESAYHEEWYVSNGKFFNEDDLDNWERNAARRCHFCGEILDPGGMWARIESNGNFFADYHPLRDVDPDMCEVIHVATLESKWAHHECLLLNEQSNPGVWSVA